MGRLLLAIFIALSLVGCATGRGCQSFSIGTGSAVASGFVADAADAAENEYDRIARELKDAESSLGRAAGRKLIARAARGVLALCALIGVGSVALLFLGGFVGVGRKQAVFGLLVAFAGVPLGYFITVYGVVVSEVFCWALMAVIFIACPVAGFLVLKAWLDARRARVIAEKRAAEGASAKDAIQRLPVSVKIKKQLDDAFDAVRLRTGRDESIEAARALLEKFNLPVPEEVTR